MDGVEGDERSTTWANGRCCRPRAPVLKGLPGVVRLPLGDAVRGTHTIYIARSST